MQLFYYKDEVGNFGDDLNPWLWPQLLPDFFNDDPSEQLVGIGTLLNHRLPSNKTLHIVGSGVGYGQLPNVTEHWKVHAVRGPYSAKALNLDPSTAVTDSALLLRNVMEPNYKADGDIGFMPHYLSCRSADWQNIAEACGFRFISPEWSVDKVFAEMAQCKFMLTEAMHGAIVADALRLPWKAVILGAHVNQVKWQDWLSTVDMRYKPEKVPNYFYCQPISTVNSIKDEIKRQLQSAGLGKNWYKPKPRNSSEQTRSEVCRSLSAIASNAQGELSSELIQNKLIVRLNQCLDVLQQ
ncbi:polysaccharide pyruvyl transferase family protein [Agarivorans sp. TSD2052]|uniref:polysaccharide pyruvyl transferase family protein n=1 Tax=Agarivorans sp. TSD2052 TaxID=2937286 RepID=UPI00200C8AA0|nr:polysaccharide pyruvyl transferase family protein [Agarivorans sp. TSD2052]UPW19192.1 polysaccharide pyruvyl transferase family protein [Agarivorans sp. TSD2052]